MRRNEPKVEIPQFSKVLINAVTGEVGAWYGACPVRRHIVQMTAAAMSGPKT
jgi:hypothetical protein